MSNPSIPLFLDFKKTRIGPEPQQVGIQIEYEVRDAMGGKFTFFGYGDNIQEAARFFWNFHHCALYGVVPVFPGFRVWFLAEPFLPFFGEDLEPTQVEAQQTWILRLPTFAWYQDQGLRVSVWDPDADPDCYRYGL